jgi:hypothetical protein
MGCPAVLDHDLRVGEEVVVPTRMLGGAALARDECVFTIMLDAD